MGIIKATMLNPRSLAVWQDSVEVGQIAEPVCLIAPADTVNERDEANARLIAAAPELLETVKNLLGMIKMCGIECPEEWSGKVEKTIESARSVVTRATTTPNP